MVSYQYFINIDYFFKQLFFITICYQIFFLNNIKQTLSTSNNSVANLIDKLYWLKKQQTQQLSLYDF